MEDGEHFISLDFTKSDFEALQDGILTIIRLSDGMMLTPENEWVDLRIWMA
jgi:hypothetical protein